MAERYELLVCPHCGHRWLTIGAAALNVAEAEALVADHGKHAHPGKRLELESFIPRPPKDKKPRPPSRRNRG
ncbi:MAG: hypothetical protein JST54_20870 [Deltaproteobacteria bacterium]|nr:hypothetical protein [Deltaproteobacteria bacterium]